MVYINGVVTAGIAEATRVAQTVIHRAGETGIVVISGQREDRARAERIPDAEAGSRIGRRPQHERDPRQGRDHPNDDPPDDPSSGSLVDLQA